MKPPDADQEKRPVVEATDPQNRPTTPPNLDTEPKPVNGGKGAPAPHADGRATTEHRLKESIHSMFDTFGELQAFWDERKRERSAQ